jgi:phage terminase large subunit GpA-like protein
MQDGAKDRETKQDKQDDVISQDPAARTILREMNATANSAMVNRTHRIIRERARTVKERRSKIRSLWIPFIIFSSLLLGVCFAVWTVLEEYELYASGSQVSGYQVVVPLLWSIPVSAAVLAVVWFRQSRSDAAR